MLVVTKTTHAVSKLGVVSPLKQPFSTQSIVPLNNNGQHFSVGLYSKKKQTYK